MSADHVLGTRIVSVGLVCDRDAIGLIHDNIVSLVNNSWYTCQKIE